MSYSIIIHLILVEKRKTEAVFVLVKTVFYFSTVWLGADFSKRRKMTFYPIFFPKTDEKQFFYPSKTTFHQTKQIRPIHNGAVHQFIFFTVNYSMTMFFKRHLLYIFLVFLPWTLAIFVITTGTHESDWKIHKHKQPFIHIGAAKLFLFLIVLACSSCNLLV